MINRADVEVAIINGIAAAHLARYQADVSIEAIVLIRDAVIDALERHDIAAGERELAHYRATTCPCTAAERFVETCPKHGIPIALSSGKTVGADQSNTLPERVNETGKCEHDGKTVGAGKGE